MWRRAPRCAYPLVYTLAVNYIYTRSNHVTYLRLRQWRTKTSGHTVRAVRSGTSALINGIADPVPPSARIPLLLERVPAIPERLEKKILYENTPPRRLRLRYTFDRRDVGLGGMPTW